MGKLRNSNQNNLARNRTIKWRKWLSDPYFRKIIKIRRTRALIVERLKWKAWRRREIDKKLKWRRIRMVIPTIITYNLKYRKISSTVSLIASRIGYYSWLLTNPLT